MPNKSSSKKKSKTTNLLEDLLGDRGIEIKREEDLAGCLNIDRYQEYDVTFKDKRQISIYSLPEKILENINQTIILDQVTGYYLGSFDFEKWFEDFVLEFRNNKYLPSTKQFPLDDLQPWGNSYEQRPKKLNLFSLEEVNKLGYQKIIFWPNREIEENSFIFSGTYYEIRRQLIDLVRGKGLEVDRGTERFYGKREAITHRPILSFYFSGNWSSKNYHKSLPKAYCSIRLTDYVCHPDDGDNVITEADARKLSQRIKTYFCQDEIFSYNKGYNTFSYISRDIGDKVIIHAESETEATTLIRLLLNIVNKAYDDRNLFISRPKNIERYDIQNQNIKVMGKQHRGAKQKITGKVFFRSASLKLDRIGYERTIVQVDKRTGLALGYDQIPK